MWWEKEDSLSSMKLNIEGKERGYASVRWGRREGEGEKPVTEEVNTRR